jgi:hypothetical protein
MSTTVPPSLEEFLCAPAEQVAAIAPTTMFLAPGGTRREAVLAGISPESEEYPRWSCARKIDCVRLLFGLGVRHLFLTALRYSPLSEVGRYRDRLIDWTAWGIAGPEALEDYARLGWRVRLVGAENVPELKSTAEQLVTATPSYWNHTLWLYVGSTSDASWASMLDTALQAQTRTRSELVRALYGEDIPPATLCLSFGKPIISADILPLIVADEVQCYWTQRPGFAQSEQTIRRIFYDYAYTRRTWRQDKSDRYGDVQAQRSLWEQPRVLGLGRRIDNFWYPAHDNIVSAETEPQTFVYGQ